MLIRVLVIQQCLNAPEDGHDEEGEEDGSGEEDKHDMGHPGQPQHPGAYDPRGPMPGPPYQPQGQPHHQQQPRGMPPQMVGGPMQAPGQYGQPYHPQMMGNDQYAEQGYMHQQ